MKAKLILMCIMVAIPLCLLACLPAPKQVSVNVSRDDFNKEQHFSQEVEVAVDGSLTLTLYSCPSEGRQWSEPAQISDQTVLQQTDHKFVMPEAEGDMPPPPGTPGQEVWTFKALKEGKSTISMEYTHPWEGGEEEPMLTFALTVVVK